VLTPPPDLDAGLLSEALREGWGIDGGAPRFLALGFGSHHWRVDAADGAWFVTVDFEERFPGLLPALTVARALADDGMPGLVAPLPSRDGSVLRREPNPGGRAFAVSVFPFLPGRTLDQADAPDHRGVL
jgi:Ser/Thr protein kinase RdoA (MazF antagonist)